MNHKSQPLLMGTIIILLVASCQLPPKNEREKNSEGRTLKIVNVADEEYVMITTAVSMPMYVHHDQRTFRKWGQRMNVKVSILGPADWDIPAQINLIEEVIGTKPSGMLINGTDPSLAQSINKAVAAGIPVVLYDSDIPGSSRDAFLGTDWYEIGRMQGNEMVRLLNGRGKIAYMGILGLTNMENGFRGLLDVVKNYPEIKVIGKFDDKASVEEAARITSDLLAAHPDLAGVCGFDSNSGPGMALAIREASKAGMVKITTVDWEPEHLALVREGVIHALIGQKRELFVWYGAQFLYDIVHKTNELSDDDSNAGISTVPSSVSTGLFKITKENVDDFRSK